MGMARLIKLLCLLIPWAVMAVPGASQSSSPNCTTVLTSVRMEVSPLLLYGICLDNNSTTLLTTCGDSVWHDNVKGFCSSFDLNIGEATIDRALPSTMITIQLLKHGYTLDAARVVVLTSEHLSKYRISVWGHQDTRFVITIKRVCATSVNESDQNLNSSQDKKEKATRQNQFKNPNRSSQHPLSENRHSGLSPGFAKGSQNRSFVGDNDEDSDIPEYMRPNKLKVPSRRPIAADEGKDPRSDSRSPSSNTPLNSTSNSLELAKLQWMEDKRVLFERKMKAIREFYANSELGQGNIREQHGAQDRDELVRGSRKQTKSYLGYEPTPAIKGNPYIENANLETNEQQENATSVLGATLNDNNYLRNQRFKSAATSAKSKSGRLRGSRKQLKQQNYARAKFNQLSRNGGLGNASKTVWDENGILRQDRKQPQLRSPYHKTSNKESLYPSTNTRTSSTPRFRGFQNRRRRKGRGKTGENLGLSVGNDSPEFRPLSNSTTGNEQIEPELPRGDQRAQVSKVNEAPRKLAHPSNPSQTVLNLERSTKESVNSTLSTQKAQNLLRNNVKEDDADNLDRTSNKAKTPKAVNSDSATGRPKKGTVNSERMGKPNKGVVNSDSATQRARNSGRTTERNLKRESTTERRRPHNRPNKGVLNPESTTKRTRNLGRPTETGRSTKGILNPESRGQRTRNSGRANEGERNHRRTTKRTRTYGRTREDALDTESQSKGTRNLGTPKEDIPDTESTTRRTTNFDRPSGRVSNNKRTTKRTRTLDTPKQSVQDTESTTKRTKNVARPNGGVRDTESTTIRKSNLGNPNEGARDSESTTKRSRNFGRPTDEAGNTDSATGRNKHFGRSNKGVLNTERPTKRNRYIGRSTEEAVDTKGANKGNINLANPSSIVLKTNNTAGHPTDLTRSIQEVLEADNTLEETTHLESATTEGTLFRDRRPNESKDVMPAIDAINKDRPITSQPHTSSMSPAQKTFNSDTATKKTTNLVSQATKTALNTTRTRTKSLTKPSKEKLDSGRTQTSKITTNSPKTKEEVYNISRTTKESPNSARPTKDALNTKERASSASPTERVLSLNTVTERTLLPNLSRERVSRDKTPKRNIDKARPTKATLTPKSTTEKDRNSRTSTTGISKSGSIFKRVLETGRSARRDTNVSSYRGVLNSEKQSKTNVNLAIPTVTSSSEDVVTSDSTAKSTKDTLMSTKKPQLSITEPPNIDNADIDVKLTYRSLHGKSYSGDKIPNGSKSSFVETEVNLEEPDMSIDAEITAPVEEPTIVPQRKDDDLKKVQLKDFQQVRASESGTEAEPKDGRQLPIDLEEGKRPSNIVDRKLTTPSLLPSEKIALPDEDNNTNISTLDFLLPKGSFKIVPKIAPTPTFSRAPVTSQTFSEEIKVNASVPTSEPFTKPVGGVPLFLPFPFMEDSSSSGVHITNTMMHSDIKSDLSSVVSSIIQKTVDLEDKSVERDRGNGHLRVSQFSDSTFSVVTSQIMPEKTKIYSNSQQSSTISLVEQSSTISLVESSVKSETVTDYNDKINISPSSTKVIKSTPIVLPTDIEQSSHTTSELLGDRTTVSTNGEVYKSKQQVNPNAISSSMSSSYTPLDIYHSTSVRLGDISTNVPTPNLEFTYEHSTSSLVKSLASTAITNQQGVPLARTLSSSSSFLPSEPLNTLKIEPTSTKISHAESSSAVVKYPTETTTEFTTPGIETTTQPGTQDSSTTRSKTTADAHTSKPEEPPKTTPSPVYNATLKPNTLDDESISTDTFWPVVAALVIGIPSVIVFGIAITVIHRRRRPDRSKFFNMKILKPIGTPSRDSIAGTPSRNSITGTPARNSILGTPSRNSIPGMSSRHSVTEMPSRNSITGMSSRNSVIEMPPRTRNSIPGMSSRNSMTGMSSRDSITDTPSRNTLTPSGTQTIRTLRSSIPMQSSIDV